MKTLAWILLIPLLLLSAYPKAVLAEEPPGRILLLTAPPYVGVDEIREVLTEKVEDVEVVDLADELSGDEESLDDAASKADAVVALGAAALPVRRWLARTDTAPRVIFVASPHSGAIGAEVALTLRVAGDVESHRLGTGMTRNTGEPQWAFPEDLGGVQYVVVRTRDLFEPLYHRYLLEEGMVLVPESSGDYFGWLARRYPSRLGDRFADARPVSEVEGTREDVLTGLPRGYLDYLAARISARSYYTTARASEVLLDGILDEVPIGTDLRSVIVDFLRRRAGKFLGEYVLPRAASGIRRMGMEWLREQRRLDDGMLRVQLPVSVTIPWKEGDLDIPVNESLRGVPRPRAEVSSIVVRAPNWWQVVRPTVGSNDWWTEVDSATYPVGPRREVFVPVGGDLGEREEVARALAEELGVGDVPAVGRGMGYFLGRGADALFDLFSAFNPRATEKRERREGDEDIPLITAIYQNKNTTLKKDRHLVHDRWEWRLDGDEVAQRTDGLRGELELDLPDGEPHEVTAASLTESGEVLRTKEWVTDEEGEHVFACDTAEEIVPEIEILGPKCWMTGRRAEYRVEAKVGDVPDEVEDLRMEFYPGEEFSVLWERPGRFEVKGAVNLRYSWRFPDGSSRHFSVTYSETMDVEVLATGFETR